MGAFTQRWLEQGRQEGIRQGVQQGILQGRESGREEGIQLGEERGRQEGQLKTLTRLLIRRFGSLDETTETRLRGASQDELDRWTDSILTARTLDEVFHLQ